MKHTKTPSRGFILKKRYILLNLAALVLLIVSLNYVATVGSRYDMETGIYMNERKITSVEMTCETDGIIEQESYHTDRLGQIIITVHALHTGKTDAHIRVALDNGERSWVENTSFLVSSIKTVVEKGRGMVNFNGFMLMLYLLIVYLLLALGVMLFSFFECLKTSQYSYRMIAFGGIVLYLGILLTVLVYKLLNNVIKNFTQLMALIFSTGDWFLLILLLPMALSAAAVSVSNIRLLRREGFRPLNALGIALSVVWLLSLYGLILLSDVRVRAFTYHQNDHTLHYLTTILQYLAVYLITYFESMLISTSLCAFLASRHTPPYDRGYIIILGCAIDGDGSLPPLLRGRADSALRFEKRQYEKTGRHAVFVPSGGQGSDEVISEGEAIENYLLAQGVAPERILREDKSTNTYENMRYSGELIERQAGDPDQKNIAFATTSYHVFRGYILSKKNGFDAQGISAKTKWYYFPNAFLREFIGLLYDQKLRHIIVAGVILLMSVFFGFASY